MTPGEFRRRYATALKVFVDDRTERSLRAAYELGRSAVAAHLGVLDIADTYRDSLSALLAQVPADETRAVATVASDFLTESLAAFEMIQRGSSEAWRAVLTERRRARMLRQLSALLADESLASKDRDSLGEILQVVAEQAREIAGARCASVYVGQETGSRDAIRTHSESNGTDDWLDITGAQTAASSLSAAGKAAICVPLLSLNGSALGCIRVEDKLGGNFSSADEAVLTHIAQMTAAAVERAQIYSPR